MTHDCWQASARVDWHKDWIGWLTTIRRRWVAAENQMMCIQLNCFTLTASEQCGGAQESNLGFGNKQGFEFQSAEHSSGVCDCPGNVTNSFNFQGGTNALSCLECTGGLAERTNKIISIKGEANGSATVPNDGEQLSSESLNQGMGVHQSSFEMVGEGEGGWLVSWTGLEMRRDAEVNMNWVLLCLIPGVSSWMG